MVVSLRGRELLESGSLTPLYIVCVCVWVSVCGAIFIDD